MEVVEKRPCDDAVDYPDFAGLLGPGAWARLPRAVRARFAGVHRSGEVTRYVGTMHRVEATVIGRLLARLARVFGTPVAPWTGEQVYTVVRVFAQPERRGVVWERIYHFRGRAPVTVRSTKCLDSNGQLVESLGRGLRMKLGLSEKDGSLRFTSTGYNLKLPGMIVPIPHWMPPGRMHVIHKDEGGGYFRFTMYTEHPWLGTMFFQDGFFAETQVGVMTHSAGCHGFFTPLFDDTASWS